MPHTVLRVRSWALVMLVGCLAGCAANLQDADTMVSSLGNEIVPIPGTSAADRFLDYALIADQTYADDLYETPRRKRLSIGDNTYCFGRQAADDGCVDTRGLTDYARARLGRWRLAYAEKDASHFPCPPGRTGCSVPLTGLGVQIWMRAPERGRVCPEAVVAFRGTDGASADDWTSNLRWLLRFLPLYDQYSQVEDYAPDFVRRIRAQPCFVAGRTRVIAVGHSLGGGLAQTAAYREGDFELVLAFDPSFVTGLRDLPADLSRANAAGLEIDRIYETGEILAYPRWLLDRLSPPSVCDPLVRTVRLHTITGNPIARHNLSSMTTALLDWSKRQRSVGRRADAPLPPPSACRPKDGRELVATR